MIKKRCGYCLELTSTHGRKIVYSKCVITTQVHYKKYIYIGNYRFSTYIDDSCDSTFHIQNENKDRYAYSKVFVLDADTVRGRLQSNELIEEYEELIQELRNRSKNYDRSLNALSGVLRTNSTK